jgi:CrcB protein
MTVLSIAIFGVCGVLARYYVGIAAESFLPLNFPYATFFVNILGAFLIGVVYVIGTKRALISAALRVGVMVGFLGGFTTFSSYCLDAIKLIEQGHYWTACFYFGLSPILGLFAAIAGIKITQILLDTLEVTKPFSLGMIHPKNVVQKLVQLPMRLRNNNDEEVEAESE